MSKYGKEKVSAWGPIIIGIVVVGVIVQLLAWWLGW